MNAVLLAILFSVASVLDYLWDRYAGSLLTQGRAHRLKFFVVIALLVVAWFQAILQIRKDRESDADMRFLKTQLSAANISLTNTTALVRQLSTGGDSYPTAAFWFTEQTNKYNVAVELHGELLRNVAVRVTDKTKRVKAWLDNETNIPNPELTSEKFVGDIVRGPFTPPLAGSVTFTPGLTNWFQIDFFAMNGFSHEIWKFYLVSNGWAGEFHTRYRRYGTGFGIMEPTNPPAGFPSVFF